MPAPIAIIRYMTVILPVVGTLLTTNVGPIGPYVAWSLGCILLVRLGDRLHATAPLPAVVELAALGLFAQAYGGLLYATLFGGFAAAAVRFRTAREQNAYAAGNLAALLLALSGAPASQVWIASTFWLTAAAWAAAYAAAERKRAAAEHALDGIAGRREQLEEARRRIMDEARQVERHAQAEERARIARELHDDLGHRMIRLKMMMEAALPLLDTRPDDARAMLGQVRGQLETAMDNMRHTVRKLKPVEQGARQYALDLLIEDAARDMRIEVSYETKGRPVPLYPSLEFALFRNAQEAITNAVRHGRASTVKVEVQYCEDEIRLFVINDGALPAAGVRAGLGLRGMEERAALLGGSVRIETDGAFSVVTTVPYREAYAAPGGVKTI